MLTKIAHATGALALAALAALASSCSPADHPSANTTVASRGDLFLRGTASDHGTPVAGAHVAIELHDEIAEAKAKVGDRMQLLTAAETTTDADGAYSLAIDPTKLRTNYFVSGRDRSMLNYDLTIASEKGWATWSGTLHWTDSSWRTDEHAAAADDPMTLDVDFGTERETTTDSFGETSTAAIPVMSRTQPSTPTKKG